MTAMLIPGHDHASATRVQGQCGKALDRVARVHAVVLQESGRHARALRSLRTVSLLGVLAGLVLGYGLRGWLWH